MDHYKPSSLRYATNGMIRPPEAVRADTEKDGQMSPWNGVRIQTGRSLYLGIATAEKDSHDGFSKLVRPASRQWLPLAFQMRAGISTQPCRCASILAVCLCLATTDIPTELINCMAYLYG